MRTHIVEGGRCTDLYLVNDTIHSQLLDLNPTITIRLGAHLSAKVSKTQSISLPYAAFDLQASYPFYQKATNYFPIRRVANSTQYTIGRTFLQEAYLMADFERNNFTIAQTSFQNLDTQHLVAIERPAEPANEDHVPPEESTSSTDLSTGAIAGIVIGVVSGLALIISLLWLLIARRRKQQQYRQQHSHFPPTSAEDCLATDVVDDHTKPALLLSPDSSELAADGPAVHEAYGSKSMLHQEMESPPVHTEVDGHTAKWGPTGVQELSAPGSVVVTGVGLGVQELGAQPVGHESGLLVEAEGCEGRRAELEGSSVDGRN